MLRNRNTCTAKKEKTGAGRNKEKRKRRGEKGGEAGLLNANVSTKITDYAFCILQSIGNLCLRIRGIIQFTSVHPRGRTL